MTKKIVVVKGVGTNLDASLVKRFADWDYHVCLIGRRRSTLKEIVT